MDRVQTSKPRLMWPGPRALENKGGVGAAAAALMTAACVAFAPSVVQAAPDSGYERYRCVVLGDTSQCPAPSVVPATRIEQRIEPGPYAHYLMYQGHDRDDAIAAARAEIGERPTRRTVQVTTLQLSAIQQYERYLGSTSHPSTVETTLSVFASDSDGPMAGGMPR